MKDLLIVANWKEYKTIDETVEFIEEFKNLYVPRENAKVIICPPFTSLATLFQSVLDSSIKIYLGAQNISMYEEGAHTGEISATQIKGLASYVIIGHSERRAMGETDEIIEKKILNARSHEIIPILCVQNENTHVVPGVEIVAYEPIEAIGTGIADTPEDAEQIASLIKIKNPGVKQVLYGGSVTAGNVVGFTRTDNISGVLVGGASLDAEKFSQIIKNA